jgi:hypothetical protein
MWNKNGVILVSLGKSSILMTARLEEWCSGIEVMKRYSMDFLVCIDESPKVAFSHLHKAPSTYETGILFVLRSRRASNNEQEGKKQ